jgi:hypothetical protein
MQLKKMQGPYEEKKEPSFQTGHQRNIIKG